MNNENILDDKIIKEKTENKNIVDNYNMIAFKDYSRDFQTSSFTHKDGFVGSFNDKKAFNNCKKYIDTMTTEDFNNCFLKKGCVNPNHKIFEVLEKETKIKPFYDIDKGFKTEKEFKDQYENLFNGFKDFITEKLPKGELAITESHGWKKSNHTEDGVTTEVKNYAMSYHVVINGYETTIPEMRQFNEINDVYSTFDFVDTTVYRTYGLMKCLNATKPWEKRYKRISINPNPLSHLLQSNSETNTGFIKLDLPIIETIKKPFKKIKIKKSKKTKDTDEEIEQITKDYEPLKMAELFQTLLNIKNKWTSYDDIIKVGMGFYNECLLLNELEAGKIMLKSWIKAGEPTWRLRPDRSVQNWNEFLLLQWDYWVDRANKSDSKITYGSLRTWAIESEINKKDKDINVKYKELSDINKKYLDIIPCDNHTWWKIGAILKRIGNSQKDWDDWCQKSETFNQKNNDFRWYDVEKYNFNESSLFFIALEHDKKKAQETKNTMYNDIIEKHLKSGTDYSMAELFKSYIKNIYCLESEGKSSFIIANEFNKWEFKKKAELGKILSTDIYQLFKNKLSVEHSKLTEMKTKLEKESTKKNTEDIETQEKYISLINKEIKRLQTQGAKSAFIGAIVDESYNSDIKNKLDEKNPFLLNFENGCYDLNTSSFKLPDVDDLVTKSTGYDYTPDIDEEIRGEIFVLLNKIYKDDTDGTTELRDYNLKVVASSLTGINKYEGFYVWTGKGANGKGLLDSLYGVTYGEYYAVIDKTFFTAQKKSSSQAEPELSDKKGIRMLVSSECEKTEEFQSGKLKILTGNDDISTRGLFQDQFQFTPQFTIFIQCNGAPNLSQVDEGIRRRFRLIEHPTHFKTSPDPDDRFQELKDSSLKTKLKTDIRYRQQMILILIEYYNKYLKDDTSGEIPMPKKVKEYTDDFIYDNDAIGQFLSESGILLTHKANDKVKQGSILEIYKKWAKENDIEAMGRNELYKNISMCSDVKKVRIADGVYFTGLKIPVKTLENFMN